MAKAYTHVASRKPNVALGQHVMGRTIRPLATIASNVIVNRLMRLDVENLG